MNRLNNKNKKIKDNKNKRNVLVQNSLKKFKMHN